MNRTENLKIAIRSWLEHPEIEQVIVIDWGSDTAVTTDLLGVTSEIVHIIRVEAKFWVLSHAFNFGLSHVHHEYTLKLDADHVLNKDFFEKHPMVEGVYYAGDWRIMPRSQEFVNGAIYSATEHLNKVGGYDERIQSYGWDDDDLKDRLSANGLTMMAIAPESIMHLKHGSKDRVRKSPTAKLHPKKSTEVNRIATWKRRPWSLFLKSQAQPFVASEGGFYIHRGTRVDEEYASALHELRNLRYKKKGLNLLMTIHHARETIGRLRARRRYKAMWWAESFTTRNILVVRVEHGLGNRLRVLASAISASRNNDRSLVVAWIPDEHCSAQLSDVISFSGRVLTSEKELDELLLSRDFSKYDLLDKEEMQTSGISPDWKNEAAIYLRSSSRFSYPGKSLDFENRVLAGLSPSELVMDRLKKIPFRHAIGFHIRTISSQTHPNLPFESSTNWSESAHRRILEFRSRTGLSQFLPLISFAVETCDEDEIVFVATDSNTAREAVSSKFGQMVRFGAETPGEMRSINDVQEACVDLFTLSTCSVIVGSAYSSFSEVAAAMSWHSRNYMVGTSKARSAFRDVFPILFKELE